MKLVGGKQLIVGLALLALVIILAGGQAVRAESNLVVGGSATAHLDFQIKIPTILYLQVGTEGSAPDLVSCELKDLPGTGAVAMKSGSSDSVTVRVAALVPATQKIKLCADSSSGLKGGDSTIKFDQISWKATGEFTEGKFNNLTDQELAVFTGSGNHTGSYAFSYANTEYVAAETYKGQVTYTVSSP